MGRDLLVLQDWIESGKIPLLGPQTSALPINQSSIYFYMLMPAFLLFKGAPVSLLYTNAALYIGTFVLGLWLLKKKSDLQKIILFVFFLISVSPQYVIQSRFVWNPSLITPFLVVSCISLYLLYERYSLWKNILFGFSLAMAVSLSYSVAPVFIAINLYLLFTLKHNKLRVIIAQIISLIILNITTIFFELRHGFLLTNMLLSRGVSPQDTASITWLSKFNSLFGYGLSVPDAWLVIAVLTLGVVILWNYFKKENGFKIWNILLFISLIISFLIPLTIHSHYIFGFTSLLFLSIAILPRVPKVLILVALSFLYLSPTQLNSYFKQAPRTVGEMNSCISQVCQDIKEPIFESVQAGFYPYHNGPEFRYLMKRAGCKVKYIEVDPNAAKLMAVVLDDSNYVNGETSYYELSMFGPAKEIKRYNCQPNFGVVILEKSL